MNNIQKKWDSTIEYFATNNPAQKKGFRIFHFLGITSVMILVMSLIGTGILSAPMYEGNKNLEMIMTAVQYLEPMATITSLLLIFKGKKEFYYYSLVGQSIVVVTQAIQGMWMGVIRAGIMIIVNTITFIRWGKDSGSLVVKKATKKMWIGIVIGLLAVAMLPGFMIQFLASGSVFEAPNVWMGWLDAVTFSLTMMSLILNVGKYREARLMQFLAAFLWPVLLFYSQIWLFGTNSIFFFFVGFSGFADWWYRAKLTPQQQLNIGV